MGQLERGLAKLTLEAFQGDDGLKRIGSLVAMYNPESINLDYAASYQTSGAVNQHHEVSWYEQVKPPMLRLELILDARGPRGGQPVDEQLANLRTLCFTVGSKGEAPYLRLTWGKMSWHGHGFFAGRLETLSIRYTLFDRTATPLRANAELELRGETSDDMAKLKAGLPPQQQVLDVPDKASLPQMLEQSEGAADASDYLQVGRANGLDNLSQLTPGKTMTTG